MGGRAGGGGAGLGSRGGGGNARKLNAAGNKIGDLMASGEWQRMSYLQKLKLLEEADRASSSLTEKDSMYSDSEWAGISAYQGSGYSYMNDALTGRKTGDKKFDAEVEGYIKGLDKAIGRRKLTKDIVVWRGSDTKESKSARFVSTSLKAKDANSFNKGNNLHAFKIPKGTHFYYSNRRGEHEVLLPKGFDLSKYKIK
jgi:hypothetical protein